MARTGARRTQASAILAALLAGASVGCGTSDAPAASAASATPSATRTKVGARGRIEPAGEVVDIGAATGDRLSALEVREGDWVEAGQVVAHLQSRDEREAEVREAQARVDQVRRLRPYEAREQEAVVARLDAELEAARRDLARLRQLEGREISQQALDTQALVVDSSAASLAEGQATLARMREAVLVDRAAAESALAAARARLESTVIRAPSAGQILKVLTLPGERISETPILKLGNTRDIAVLAEVYETDAGFVRPGQRVTVRSAALPGPLSGTVERVSPIVYKANIFADDPTAATDARVVETWIRLDPTPDAPRFIHLRVDVEIDLGSTS